VRSNGPVSGIISFGGRMSPFQKNIPPKCKLNDHLDGIRKMFTKEDNNGN
jgi:hypothetical protein